MRYQIPDTGYQLMPGIHILQANFYMILDFHWAIYIKLNHGIIPEDGQIKETIEIPIETLVNSLTATDDEMKDYWFQKRKRNGDSYTTTENPNHSTWYKYFSVIYRPLLVIDYSSIFKYF